jgi:hypothetical protein
MLFDLDVQQGEWFPFQNSRINPESGEVEWDEPEKDAKVQIRPMGPFFEEKIMKRKRVAENVYNPKTRAMERVSFFQELSAEEAKHERDEAFDYAIIGLQGFKNSKSGEVIQCTRENKLALMRVPAFDRFFAKCQQLLSSSGVKAQEEAEKNS